MAEQAQDVKETVEQVTTTPESSTDETKESAVQSEVTPEEAQADKEIAAELEKESKSEDTEDAEDTEEVAEVAEEEAEETPEEPLKGAEARKEQLNTEIRDLVSKRNELRDEVTRVNAQVYQPQTPDELVEAGMDPAMARVEALEQRTQMAEYNAHVTDLNANLNIESLQVMSDFPVFNPDAPEYDKSLADRAKSVYERAAAIQTDPKTGLIVQANVLPYEIYKAFAETAQSGAQSGTVAGQIAAEKNLAAADTVSSAAPKQPKEDLFLKGLMGE